ncbi:MAG: chemotaxis protein CheC [Longimicrobiales bacterium]
MDIRELGALQLDALREVSNMGGGHAATALSQMTGRRIMVEVPQIRIIPIEDVGELTGNPEEVVASVLLQVLGDLTGRAMQIFPGATAARVTEILTGTDGITFPDGFGEMECSALNEVGNIVTGAYLNALSEFMGMLLLTSVPSLSIDQAQAVLTSSYLEFGRAEEVVLCIDTHFLMDEATEQMRGHFLLLPDPPSLKVMLEALRLA